MSATDIIKELPRLTEAERWVVLQELRALAQKNDDVRACDQTADEQAAALDRMEEKTIAYRTVDLPARGIGETQATDLRVRLKTFAEDWNRPEAAIYDENPAR